LIKGHRIEVNGEATYAAGGAPDRRRRTACEVAHARTAGDPDEARAGRPPHPRRRPGAGAEARPAPGPDHRCGRRRAAAAPHASPRRRRGGPWPFASISRWTRISTGAQGGAAAEAHQRLHQRGGPRPSLPGPKEPRRGLQGGAPRALEEAAGRGLEAHRRRGLAGVRAVPRCGDVFWVALDPTRGTEIRKTRPAVVISNNSCNTHGARLVVLSWPPPGRSTWRCSRTTDRSAARASCGCGAREPRHGVTRLTPPPPRTPDASAGRSLPT